MPMPLTPQQQLIANAYRRSLGQIGSGPIGVGPTVPALPILPGTSGVDIGATPAPSSGGFNLDQALMPPSSWAPKPPEGTPLTDAARSAWDLAKKSFSTDWSQPQEAPAAQPPMPRARPAMGPQSPGADPSANDPMAALRQLNYGDAAQPDPAAPDPAAMAMPDQAGAQPSSPQPPVPQPRPPVPGMRPMMPAAMAGQAPQGDWPPMPVPRPEMQGPPASNVQPEGITSAGAVAPAGAGMTSPEAAAAGVSPERAAGLWDRIRSKFDDPDVARNLMNFGLATMAASSRPGTSFLGAVGQGGMSAMQQADTQRRLDIQQGQLNRQEARDNRRLTLEEQRLVQEAELKRQQWIEMANRADLDRQARADAAAAARELRQAQIQMQAGNAQAANDLRALIAQGNLGARQDANRIAEEANRQRAEDRAANQARLDRQDAENRQARVDNQAMHAADTFIRSQRNKDTGRLPGGVDEEELRNDYLRRNWGSSSVGKALLDTPIEPPVQEVEVEPGSMMPQALGGTPPKTEKRVDRTKLFKGQLYTLPNGQVGRFNGSGFEPVQ